MGLCLLDILRWVSDLMDELAPHAVGAVSIGAEFLAHFGLVEDGHVGLDHHLGLLVGEGALQEYLISFCQIWSLAF